MMESSRLSRPGLLRTYLFLAFGLSWGVWWWMAVTGVGTDESSGLTLCTIALFGPSVAGLAAVFVHRGRVGLSGLLKRLHPSRTLVGWYGLAFSLPFLVMVASLFVSSPMSSGDLSWAGVGLGWLALTSLRVFVLGGPLGEELGWRGVLLPGLTQGRSVVRAATYVGLIWGIWHLPLYFVSGTGQWEQAQEGGIALFVAFVLWVVALSIIQGWLFVRTGGSLVAQLIFHTGVNVAALLPALIGAGGMIQVVNGVLTWVVAIVVMRSLRTDRGSVVEGLHPVLDGGN